MKMGSFVPSGSDYEVELPQEIIACILSKVRATYQVNIRKRTFWSCCLLSKTWYAASIAYLYESPQLSNKNFDKFARTICPPVNSHVKHVGLENFICHLDMGSLAYESSKSLTSRLLRRTRRSLETFIAPAVSFSVSCLAPLSKCLNLRTLDLSRDFYDIDLTQLLNAVGDLPQLTTMCLPRSAMKRRCKLKSAASGRSPWPLKLSRLQISDWLPHDSGYWQELVASWPSSITSLACEDGFGWDPFFHLHQSQSVCPYITTLKIGMRREEDGFPIEMLLQAFPRLVSLAIPTPTQGPALATMISNVQGKGADLKSLTFLSVPTIMQAKPKLTVNFLSACIVAYSKLLRIEIPESYLDADDEALDDLTQIEDLISQRQSSADGEVGIFLMDG